MSFCPHRCYHQSSSVKSVAGDDIVANQAADNVGQVVSHQVPRKAETPEHILEPSRLSSFAPLRAPLLIYCVIPLDFDHERIIQTIIAVSVILSHLLHTLLRKVLQIEIQLNQVGAGGLPVPPASRGE